MTKVKLCKFSTTSSSQKFKRISNNNNNYHFLGAYYVLGTVLSTLYKFLQLILPSLKNAYYLYPHFTDEKIGT